MNIILNLISLPEIHRTAGPDGQSLGVAHLTARVDSDKPRHGHGHLCRVKSQNLAYLLYDTCTVVLG